MRKETLLKQHCDTTKIKERNAGKYTQFYILISGKQYTAKTRKALIEKLFDLYCGDAVTTLEEAYKEWMLWLASINTSSKTLKENKNEWTGFIKDTKLATMQVAKIEIADFEDFLYDITKDYAITSKRLSNILSVLNGILRRCVSRGIIAHNNFLAIRFSFYAPLRICETCAIKYCDIENGLLYIRRAQRTCQKMNDDLTFEARYLTNDERIKGNKESGFRAIPLTDTALSILELTHNLYPDNEYLFMRDGKQIITDTFNEELKKICEHLGIKYRSSHQIRFTVATLLYSNGVPITQLSTLLGHADTAMTWHYIRKQTPDTNTSNIMQAVLG